MSWLVEEMALARSRTNLDAIRSVGRAALTLGLSILVFFPVFPSMPSARLDPSWRMALNEAWVRGFDFAQDMVFTYGPYAFVSTGQYHPATFVPLVICSLLLGTVLFLLLRQTGLGSRGTFRVPFILLCLIASGYTSSPDVRFLCYPFLLLVVAAGDGGSEAAKVGRVPLTAPVVLNLAGFSLGLICLVKATYAVEIGALGVLTTIVLYATGRRVLAAAILVSFGLGLTIFWLAAGQALTDLPRFFLNQAEVAAGYSEAMSSGGNFLLPLLLFICAAIPLAVVIKHELQLPTVGKQAMAVGMAVTVFLSFKEGFVRLDDWHVMVAAEVLFILPWCWPCDRVDVWRRAHAVAAGLTVLLFLAMFPYALDFRGKTASFEQLLHCSDRGPIVCPTRAGWLKSTYDLSLARIRAYEPLPKLRGTVDVYTVSQALAIANGYRWDPRPVMQSYSAYTPALELMNAGHLIGAKAPDDVFFALEPTDGRLPSFSDGPSWPILLTRYSVTWLGIPAEPSAVPPIALLKRRPDAQRISVIRAPLVGGTVSLGQRVDLPSGDGVLFAQIDLRPSAYGRFEEMLYKGPELYINLLFPGGRVERYRFIPGMARAGFIISPAVTDAREFVALRDLQVRPTLSSRRPVAFWLSGAPGARLMWRHAAAVEISKLLETSH